MLLTITTTQRPATDLGFLLHKNLARVHDFDLSFGRAHVFYPEATEERCQICLLLKVDPIRMVRRQSGPAGSGGIFDQYVNDRPYVASSFLSVANSRDEYSAKRQSISASVEWFVGVNTAASWVFLRTGGAR